MLEKATYIKGLVNGLGLDTDKKETKVILELTNIIEEMARKIDDLEASCEEAHKKIDIVDDDLAFLEEDFYDEDGCCNCEECDDCFDDLDDDDLPDIECPSCRTEITITMDDVKAGKVTCPNCDTVLELELERDDEEDENEL